MPDGPRPRQAEMRSQYVRDLFFVFRGRQRSRLPDELLFLGLDPPFQLFDVFFRRKPFRLDATLAQHVAHAFVVLHVLAGDG